MKAMTVEKNTEWLILMSVVVVGAFAYILAWCGKQVAIRRIGSVVGAAICTMAALVATTGYGMPALLDLLDNRGAIDETVIENVVIWIICIAVWEAALRFSFLAFRSRPLQRRDRTA